jgi:hypothetical protein
MRCRFMCLTHLIMLIIKADKHITEDHGELNKVPTVTGAVYNRALSLPAAFCAVSFIHLGRVLVHGQPNRNENEVVV